MSNELWLLKIGKNPVEWIKIENLKGKPPLPRYQHSMNYYENKEIIIIHGGRNDHFNSESFSMNTTFIIDLCRWQWIEVRIFNNYYESFKIFERCSHGAVIWSKLI